MSHTVTSLLIPIQLCGGKKTKCHRYKCTYDISVFLPRFNAKSRYCNDRICKFLVIIYVCNCTLLFYDYSFIFLDITIKMHVIRCNQYKVYLILVKSNIACSYCCINENRSSFIFMRKKREVALSFVIRC